MNLKELEIKFLDINKEEIRKKLIKIHAKLINPEYLMRRKTFDFSQISPGKNKWGRVRQESDKITMAIKEITGEKIDDVFETEITVNDFDKACKIFEDCNVKSKSYQENKREEWIYNNNIFITIDTWPGLSPFIEIESESIEAIKKFTEILGYSYEKGIIGSIDIVYEKVLGISKQEIITLPEITFDKIPTKKLK